MSLLMPAESAPTPHHYLSTMLDWARALRYRMVVSVKLATSPAASVSDFESLYIIGVFVPLGPCAVTRSPQDGCFQAHLRAVTARRCPFSLRLFCRTLADDLGCFPRVPGPSHPGTDSRMITSWYSEFPRDWYRGRPTRTL